MITIVIPVYNEENVLAGKAKEFTELSRHAELIFVDGESSDSSGRLATSFGKVISSKRGRAIQMNGGASHASGEILLFLHADNIVSSDALSSIERYMQNGDVIGGCLTQRIAKLGIAYRLIEAQGNLRARLSRVFYGDQGIFVRKDIFMRIAGFPATPIMEDVLFTRRLRALGKTVVLPDEITVSPRRWERKGPVRTATLYAFIAVLFRLGLPLSKIKLLYDDVR